MPPLAPRPVRNPAAEEAGAASIADGAASVPNGTAKTAVAVEASATAAAAAASAAAASAAAAADAFFFLRGVTWSGSGVSLSRGASTATGLHLLFEGLTVVSKVPSCETAGMRSDAAISVLAT